MTEDAFVKLLEVALRKAVPSSLVPGKVTSVDKEKRTCDIEREGQPELFGVRLNAIIDNTESHCTVFPKEGSFVIAGLMGGAYVVLVTSEVESLEGKIGEQSFVFNTDGWAYNNGKLGGMVKIEKMVEWMDKVYSDLQTLKTQLQTHPVAGKGAPLALPFNVTAAKPQKSMFENENVKQ